MDLFWPGVLMVEQKSPGKSLGGALDQAEQYFLSIKDSERPRYLLACDFGNFALFDLASRATHEFALEELPDKLGLFGFVTDTEGGDSPEHPISTKASRLMSEMYLGLKRSGYGGRDVGYLLTRLAYCLFADDTGVFEHHALHRYLEKRTAQDGHDLGPKLVELFQVLDTPVERRQSTLDEDLAGFPYIDGALFAESISIPALDSAARGLLLEASSFDWSGISPAIFGSLFQSVMSAKEVHDAGAHYTSEENIMKVAGPLFLDGLKAELAAVKARRDAGRKRALERFREKLGGLKFLDPACGSGNFLIVAYRELRRLELEAMVEIRDPRSKRFDPAGMPRIGVGQFYGIELDGFSAKIAETAMWMTDHLANNEISRVYGDSYVRIPLKERANILNADALETDWNEALPAEECSYILGNPPFLGAKVMSARQRAQVARAAGGGGGTLDYVAAWFFKSVEYAPDAKTGFVSTNSVTQGEQVGQLWPAILGKHEIAFAHKSFEWDSDAAGKAHVHVVVTGLARKGAVARKRLFDGKEEENPRHISPYLIGFGGDAPLVSESARRLNGLPKLVMGSKPIDGGHYIFTAGEKDGFLAKEPGAAGFLRPYIGSREFINGGERWILALHGAEPSELKAMPEVAKRVEAVRRYRSESRSPGARKLAETPTRGTTSTSCRKSRSC